MPLDVIKVSFLIKGESGSNDQLWRILSKNGGFINSHTRFSLDVDVLANFFTARLSLPTDFNSVLPALHSETSTAVKGHKVSNVLGLLEAVGADGISCHMLRFALKSFVFYRLYYVFTRLCRSDEISSS